MGFLANFLKTNYLLNEYMLASPPQRRNAAASSLEVPVTILLEHHLLFTIFSFEDLTAFANISQFCASFIKRIPAHGMVSRQVRKGPRMVEPALVTPPAEPSHVVIT